MTQSAYALAGVDYTKIDSFKKLMQDVGRRTLEFPNRRWVEVTPGAHGASFRFVRKQRHAWAQTQEGLGNKNWIAEWMYQRLGAKTYYDQIAEDVVLMAVNDLIAQGALPCLYTDEVAAGDSDWFADLDRAQDLADGFFRICKLIGACLPAGESPSLKYLVNALPPVKSAPSLSGCATGIITSFRYLDGRSLGIKPGDRIIGVTSSGMHANGASLVIKKALKLRDKFLTCLPNGNSLGAEALIPTRSYVALVEALLDADVEIHDLLPGTGGGVSKIPFAKEPFIYFIENWVEEIPPLFRFMNEVCGVGLEDCLTTFNWGIGYYIFAPRSTADRVIQIGTQAGYELIDLGVVQEGGREVIFERYNMVLEPPGE